MTSRLTVHREDGRGAEGTRRDHGGFSCRGVPRVKVLSHTHGPPFPRWGARNSLVAVPHRAGQAVKVKRGFSPFCLWCVQALVGRQDAERACCLQGPSRGDPRMRRDRLCCPPVRPCPLTTRSGVGRLVKSPGPPSLPPPLRTECVPHPIPLLLATGVAIASAQLVSNPGRPKDGRESGCLSSAG
jgi:hypothetical protein